MSEENKQEDQNPVEQNPEEVSSTETPEPSEVAENSENRPVNPEMEAVEANRPQSEGEKPVVESKQENSVENPQSEQSSKTDQSAEANKVSKIEEKPVSVDPSSAKVTEDSALSDKKESKVVAPKKIGKEKSKRKSNAKFLTIMGLSLAGLFVVFIVLMVLVIAGGGEQSPVLDAFGLDASGIKRFLLGIVNFSFGFLGFLFFILATIGVFKMLFAKKGDKEGRGRGIKMMLVGVIPMIFVMFIWLFLYTFISKIEIAAERVKAEILVLNPTDLTNLQAPLEVTFSSENVIKSLQGSGFSVDGVKWDFDGDGKFETEATEFEISYLYNLNGNFNVGLEVVVVGEDIARTYNYPLVIEAAVFGANPDSGTAPLDVQFDASALIPKGAKVKSLDWDFDGDSIYELTGKDNLRPKNTFKQIGTYSVHLRFVDQDNLVENYYRDIEIVPGDKPLLTAIIEATPGLSGALPFQVRFDGGKSESVKGKISNYEWNFGDGSQLQKGESVSNIYNKSGTYTVDLTVIEDSGKTTTSSVDVIVSDISSVPEARITTTPPADSEGVLMGDVPFKVEFDASSSTDADDDIVKYDWDFGDDNKTQVGEKVEYTYLTAGTYMVTLIVEDSEGQKHNSTLSIIIEEPGVKSVITANPGEGTAPLVVDFDGSSSSAYEGNIVSYEWDFGDESPKSITGAKITHKYTAVGTYTVKLKVVTNKNESNESEQSIYVREVPLRACFEPSRSTGTAPLAVTFESKCSTGAVDTYSWDFGDGETSDVRKPAHTFENAGTYSVTLEVSDDKNNVNTYSDVIVATGDVE